MMDGWIKQVQNVLWIRNWRHTHSVG